MRIFLSLLLVISFVGAAEIKIQDQNETDAIYLLPLKKYPKWLCEATLKNAKSVRFASVKSLMTVYLHQDYFKKHKLLEDSIDKIYVQDYINGRKIEAKNAFYLFGSRVIGPHGDDLIPFETKKNAELFMLKNGGTKILRFNKLTAGLIRYLDM